MHYYSELAKAVETLATKYDTIFLGQAIQYLGTGVTAQFEKVMPDKLVEMPVCEELQMGMSLGLALAGYVPISVFPRYDFLLLAANQLVTHLDKWPLITDGKSTPKVIIKVGVGSATPINPGTQHLGNYSEAFRSMCKTIDIIDLTRAEDIAPAYDLAYSRGDGRSTILVEYADLYKN